MKRPASQRVFAHPIATRLFLTAWVLAAWPTTPSRGQTVASRQVAGGYQATAWSDQDGLPDSTVSAVISTSDGYLWLGSVEGVTRFDGVRFTVFDGSNTPALRGCIPKVLASARSGGFWVGSENGGVCRWQDGAFTRGGFSAGLANSNVRALWEEPSGDLWIGTDAGLSRLHGGQLINCDVFRASPRPAFEAIVGGRDGEIWIGSSVGVARFLNGQFTSYGTREGLPASAVHALLYDRRGTLWIGTDDGLYTMGAAAAQPAVGAEALAHASIYALLEGADGTIWVGSTDHGLYRSKQPGQEPFVPQDGTSNNDVRSLFESADGDLWIGGASAGLTRLRHSLFASITGDGNPSDQDTHSLCQDKTGTVWAVMAGELKRCDDGHATALGPPEQPPKEVEALTTDADGSLWAATDVTPDGQWLYRWTGSRFAAQEVAGDLLPGKRLRGLLRDRAGNWVVGKRDTGVHMIGLGGTRIYGRAQGLGDDYIVSLYQDRAGAVWIGTRAGGMSRLQDGKITHWTTGDGLGSNHILSFHEDGNGTLWIGTHGGGLCRLKDGRLKTITRADGLYDDLAFAILEDDGGNLWMSCNKGIYRASLEQLNDFADGRRANVESFSYDAADGMISRECNDASTPGLRTNDGRLWFATIRGVAVVDPRQRNLQPPRVIIEQARVDQTPCPSGPLQIRPGQEELELQYTALSWQRPQHIRFRYQLVGLDKDWRPTNTRRAAFYSHLPPGEYRFRVQADNGDGVWSPEGASLAVTVLPPFWRTSSFLTALAASVGLLAYGTVRWRSRHLRRRTQALERLVAARTVELRQAKEAAESANHAKSAFLASMSHELRTPLNAVLGYTQLMLKEATPPDRAHDHERLTVVHQSGSHLLAMINEVLDLAKIEAGKVTLAVQECSLEALLEEVAASFRPRAAEKGLEFREERAPGLPAVVCTDAGKLRQVLLNLLGNALKFTEHGHFALQVTPAGQDRVRFAVEDTGIGIPESEQAQVFEAFHQAATPAFATQGVGLGLAISHRLVDLLGGRLAFESLSGKGSRFYFDLSLPEQAATLPVVARPNAAAPSGYVGPRRRVLIADDVAANRGVLRGMLEPLGFLVEEAVDGEACLARCAQAPPHDVLLLDLRMPRLDGLSVARTLRSRFATVPFKIVAVSASVFPADARQALDAGCDDFLPKPCEEARLLETLGRLLDLEWVRPVPAGPSDDARTGRETPGEPAAEEIAHLEELARIGDILEFKEHLAELARTEPGRYGALAARLAPLIASYQTHRLQEELRR